ncbi:MAG TPA: sigma-54-dependent Fis family transcriptional regulator [Planctomycetes bacterium]|nr:sigma-54-dependent Fis family transcriptional regulator [Planctomycetota bacterium]
MTPGPSRETILVVDDTASTLEVLQRSLSSQGYVAYVASDAAEAVRFLECTPVDLVVTDLKMPKVSGIDVVRHIRENHRDTEVMMVTGYATVESAVEAVKHGAAEYLAKPFTDEELFAAVRRVLDRKKERAIMLPPADRAPAECFGLLGTSPAMARVISSIRKATTTSATCLIVGESGSGKELVARAIHYHGPRAPAPFVPINCGGIPEGLLESELFGYVKGAFTGAHETRAGFFQTADGGTIFLDEISETSLGMQVKLLRVLQEKEVYMVGDSRPRRVDVRIIAATNKDLPGLIASRAFREELYYRINVVTIEVPPLRERGDDVLLLAGCFAQRFAGELGKPVPHFSDKAMDALMRYGWPGNVRELENVVQRMVVMVDGQSIDVPDLPQFMRFSAFQNGESPRTLAEVETEHIRKVCASAGGNRSRAAAILGIDRKTLREKLKRAGID